MSVIPLLAFLAALVAFAASSGGESSSSLPAGRDAPPWTPPELDDPAGVFAPGAPLAPAELADYIRAAVHAANGAIPAVEPYQDAIAAARAELDSTPGRGTLIAEGKQRFGELAKKLQANLSARRAELLPAGSAAAGQGPTIVWWPESALTYASWNPERTDWYGRHYQGGSMWANLAAGGGILADGFKTTGIELWKNVKAAAPYLEFAASLVPVYGPWLAGAIHLAYTGDLDESVKAAIRAAVPGGPAAQLGVDVAFGVIEGQSVDQAALGALWKAYPEAKLAYEATLAAKGAIEDGDVPEAVEQAATAYQQASAAKHHVWSDFS